MTCYHCHAATDNGLALCERCRMSASIYLEFLPVYVNREHETMYEAAVVLVAPRPPLTHSTSISAKEGIAMKATRRMDLTGQQFGRLTALHYEGGNACRWVCRCECGTTKSVAGGDLRNGRTTSCGCRRRKVTSERFRLADLTGQNFGRLTVVGFSNMKAGESYWTATCVCGATTVVRGWMLRDGSTRSCGCLHRERARESRTKEPTYSAIHTRLRVERGSAKDRSCVDCSRTAEQWSYNHCGSNERVSGAGFPYSEDLDSYDPRCVSCHRIFDLANGGLHD